MNWRTLLLKYKLLHVIMWTITGTWTFVMYFDPADAVIPQVSNTVFVTLFSMLPFYITAYILVPGLLYKRRFFLLIISLIALVIITAFLTLVAARVGTYLFKPSYKIIPGAENFRFLINLFVWNSLIAVFGGGSLKIMSDSFRLTTRLAIVEKEKISTELNFLRSQINPHFLFNVLNTIYFQIDKSNTHARESVEKMSEMLRYQLYDCITDRIEIEKELDYIRNYVTMQTLRMEKGSRVELQIQPGIAFFKLAPMIILPMVENAFKHVSVFKDASQNFISIRLSMPDKDHFLIQVLNSYDDAAQTKLLFDSGGLGIQNLTRRLQLLYPVSYKLDTLHENGIFNVALKLNIND